MRFAQPDKLLGILPLSVLLSNRKTCNLCKWPISRGILLWKLLFWRVRILKKLKFPTYGVTGPTSFEDCRSNTVTLWCRRPQVTPCHWQKWMLSFQVAITPEGSWVILDLKWSNAKWSDYSRQSQRWLRSHTRRGGENHACKMKRMMELNSSRNAPYAIW